MKKSNWLNNNRGFSIMELLIVMAIVSIISGFVGISYSLVTNSNVNAAANKLESAIKTSRVESMSRGQENGKLTIVMADKKMYYVIGEYDSSDRFNWTEICKKQISCGHLNDVNSRPDSSTTSTAFTELETVVLYFNSAGMVERTNSTPALTDSVTNCFTFDNGDRRIAVWIYPETGKVETAIY